MSQIVQLHVVSGANIEGGVNITGGLNADSITQNGSPVAGTVHVGGNGLLTGDGSVGNPLTAVSQFGSDTIVQLPNALSSPVNALELLTTLTATSQGSETSQIALKSLLSGSIISNILTALNGIGRQTASTNTSTPTVALNPRADILVISVNADTTSLTITGTDLDTDFEYQVSLSPAIGATSPSLVTCDLNGSTSTYAGLAFAAHSAGSGSILTRIQLIDNNLTGDVGMARLSIRKIAGKVATWDGVNFTTEGGGTFIEFVTGNSNITANVTSLVLNGAIGNGSVVVLKRHRFTVA